uniref:CN hydrolase domain-containing protein n=1 Tax=Panagrellus redivivus TaxID=6233 RepID=A0A7E4VJ90_PANRE
MFRKGRDYWNVGNNCPPDMCTLVIEPIGGIMGLAVERHDGNVYGLFDDTNTLACPREVVDGLFNFTVVDLPECPVIVDGAVLPNNEVKVPKDLSSGLL